VYLYLRGQSSHLSELLSSFSSPLSDRSCARHNFGCDLVRPITALVALALESTLTSVAALLLHISFSAYHQPLDQHGANKSAQTSRARQVRQPIQPAQNPAIQRSCLSSSNHVRLRRPPPSRCPTTLSKLRLILFCISTQPPYNLLECIRQPNRHRRNRQNHSHMEPRTNQSA
jgi:hypothetical protein